MDADYRIIILPKAGKNIEAIHDYIAESSPAAAAGMIEEILEAIDLLIISPHRTEVVPQTRTRRPVVRSISVRSYVVYFRVFDDERVVRVVRVQHGARKRPRRFD